MFLRKTRGQGLAEYALILALIAILAITALMFLSGQIDTILSRQSQSPRPTFSGCGRRCGPD